MAKKFTFDDAITTDIKGAASNSYIDNIKMIKIADIETNAENFYSLPDIEELAEDIDRKGLIHSLAVAKISSEKYKLISGHRRLTAIKLLIENGKWNNETVPCYVITAKKSDAENKEIKRLAAVNGEKPKYRMVAPELLDNIKQSGIQFAYFKKGDKYNIVFLRKNETEIDQLLKQLRKEK